MPGGRPPLGPAIVEGLDLPEAEKRRLRAVLEVISERRTVEEACAGLAISRAQFYELERKILLSAGAGAAPKPPGRPPSPPPSPEAERIRALEARVKDLELDLAASRVREDLAIAFPWYARRLAAPEKKRATKPPRL